MKFQTNLSRQEEHYGLWSWRNLLKSPRGRDVAPQGRGLTGTKGFAPLIILISFVVSGFSQDVSIHGYARTYLGVLTNEPYDYSISQNTIDLKLEGSVGKGGFYANPYLYQYPN
ncbi:MAG: hypothetical protein KAS49_01965, partial [Candidatus Cloacimonetes bacterium]|nr:hypothetical protein [Candidatus Cloacimonadota bacterium]